MIIKKIKETQLGNKKYQAALQRAGQIIRDGGLVAFPTETVYGLGANALDERAAGKIYSAKGRPSDNPLIVHVAKFEDIQKITKSIPWQAKKLAEAFWPGPLTMIMEKSDIVPMTTTGGLDTVAIRMPSNEIALALIEASGGYIAAPSANTSGRPSPTKASHVAQDLDGKIDMLIDGGEVGIGLESTIVDLTSSKPVILRPGAITAQMMFEAVGCEFEIDKALIKEDETVRPKAPGMKYKHYAPKADLMVVEGDITKVSKYINSEIEKLLQQFYEEETQKQESVFDDLKRLNEVEGKIGVICCEETKNMYQYGYVKSVGKFSDEDEIARNLYSVLREFDRTQVEIIFSESFYTPNMGAAIMNRLLKAAGHHRIKV